MLGRLEERLSKKAVYNCKFIKNIYKPGESPEKYDPPACILIAETILPFVPQIGMSVLISAKEHDFYSDQLKTVYWKYNSFVCEVDPILMKDEWDLNTILSVYKGRGWKVSGNLIIESMSGAEK